MIIKIEIDVKPEELRRFLGLPDVGGLQEDMIHYVRDKMTTSVDGFDPTEFIKDNIQGTRAWKTLMSLANGSEPEEETVADKPKRKRTAAAKKK